MGSGALRTIPARAVYFASPRRIEVRDVEVPLRPGEVQVQSSLAGISHGTEMLFYRGPFPAGQELEALPTLSGASGYPVRYGYINVGRLPNGRRVFGFQPHQSAFSTPPESLIPLPDDVSDDDAVFLPSMETALQITHDCAPRYGEQVLLLGLGVIGTLVGLLLADSGVRILAADPDSKRRRRAEELGFTAIDPSGADAAREARDITSGGPDHAINTSAREEALQLALDSLRMEGTLVEASWYGGRAVNLVLGTAFHRRRLTIRASQVSHINPRMQPRWDRVRRTETVLRLLREMAPGRFISHRFPLERAAEAFEMIDGQKDDVFQAVLVP